VGTFFKNDKNAQKFIYKAVEAAYGTVAPPSEFILTILEKKLMERTLQKEKEMGEMHKNLSIK